MRKFIYIACLFLGLCLFAEKKLEFSVEELQQIKSMSPLPKLKPDPTNKVSLNEKAALFGEKMFGDWRFSKGEEFACQTCHRTTDNWMTVRTDTSKDIPTLWNMGHNKWFFWDGRADSLWAQALGPIENPIEHDSSRGDVASLIYNDIDYRKAYEELFGKVPDLSDQERFPVPAKPAEYDLEANKNWQKMTSEDQHTVNTIFVNVGKSLAAFQESIISPKTDFDVFVEGIKEANPQKLKNLSISAQRGLKVFLGKGKCVDCHSGPNFSDSLFHNTQLPKLKNKPEDKGHVQGAQGVLSNEFNGIGKYSDDAEAGKRKLAGLVKGKGELGKFKTPTLRNIMKTHPFMHDGHFNEIAEVINFYSEMKGASMLTVEQKKEIEPRHFTNQEKADLLAFIKSLSTLTRNLKVSK